MRNITDKGNMRTISDYFSPKSKVRHFIPLGIPHQQCSPSQQAPSHQETPMNPSRVPNRLSNLLPKRMLPLHSPEMCCRGIPGPPHPPPQGRPGPPQSPPHPRGPCGSPGSVPSNENNFNSPARNLHPTPMTPNGSQAIGPTSRRGIGQYSPLCSMKRDQLTEPKVLFPTKDREFTQRPELNKVGCRDVGSSGPAAQPHRPSVLPALTYRSGQESHPSPLSHSEPWSPDNSQWRPGHSQASSNVPSPNRSGGPLSPTMQSPVATRQDHASQQYSGTPLDEKSISGHRKCLSRKRCRISQDGDTGLKSAKKLRLHDTTSGPTETPNCTAGRAHSPSPASKTLSCQTHLELSPETTDSQLGTEAAPRLSSGQSSCLSLKLSSSQSSYLAQSPKLSPSQSRSSLSPRSHSGRQLPGVKPASMKITLSPTRPKEFTSPVKQNGEHFKREIEEEKRGANISPLDSPARQVFTGQKGVAYMDLKVKDSTCNSPSGSCQTGHTQRTNPALEVQPLSQADSSGETRGAVLRSNLMSCDVTDSRTPRLTPKPNSASPHSHTLERRRTAHPRRPVLLDDISDLFTPDAPVSLSLCGLEKPGAKEGNNSPAGHKRCVPSTVAASSSSVLTTSAGSPCSTTPKAKKTVFCPAKDAEVSHSSSVHHPNIVSMALVRLERLKPENCPPTNGTGLRNGHVSFVPQFTNETVVMDTKLESSLTPNSVGICKDGTYEAGATTSKANSTSHHSPATCLGSQEGQGDEDPLDLGLSPELDLDLTQSSQSSDDEQLLSLQEMMEHSAKPPDTPVKGTFSEPRSPVHPSCQNKPQQPLPPSKTKPGTYKNSLDQMLQEMNGDKRTKEIETKLCDLLKIAGFEEADENQEEAILPKEQEFIQCYSVVCSAIRDVHPGELVFNLEHFGRLFNQDTLQLRQCKVNPLDTAQKTLLWSSPTQFRSHVSSGLYEDAYSLHSPCPSQVTRFLFKMMSVHRERMISEQILAALKHIADTAARQIVTSKSQQFEVWVPSVADVTQVLMNMGIPFVTLFPLERLQPPFSEGDMLEDIQISSSPSTKTELSAFPDHNFENIFKYLAYCMKMCPRAYSDYELLLLLTVASRVGLDTQLTLRPNDDLRSLQHHIINNIREWDTMLPRICLALTDLTADHHNMCRLVQLLPDKTRGKQLRRHLSLSMISKLLNGSCTYRPTNTEFLLSDLRPYLPRMEPKALLRGLLNSRRKQNEEEEDLAMLDQQAYYLCHSLLTLVNEAANFPFFPPHQKEQLLSLCSVLERHIKCNIRESAKCLYRSKVKDLVARIYTTWQILLKKTRPLQGKLYDYWKPPPEDTMSGSETEEETEEDDNEEEDPVMEEEETVMEDEEEVEREEEEIEDIGTAMVVEELEEEEQEGACITMNDSHTKEDNSEGMRMDTATDEDEEGFVEEKDWVIEKGDEGVEAKEGDGTADKAKEETVQTVNEYGRETEEDKIVLALEVGQSGTKYGGPAGQGAREGRHTDRGETHGAEERHMEQTEEQTQETHMEQAEGQTDETHRGETQGAD